MGMEDQETTGSSTVVTRYGLGARGVDLIERTSNGAVTTGFPLYDPDSLRSCAPLGVPEHAHGNNVATLSRTSNGGYAVNDHRSYDAWDAFRNSVKSGKGKTSKFFDATP